MVARHVVAHGGELVEADDSVAVVVVARDENADAGDASDAADAADADDDARLAKRVRRHRSLRRAPRAVVVREQWLVGRLCVAPAH